MPSSDVGRRLPSGPSAENFRNDPALLNGAIEPFEFKLEGRTFKADVTNAIVREGSEAVMSIDGAPTISLGLYDSDRVLLESGIYNDRARVTALGCDWELVKTVKDGDLFTVTFEPVFVVALRRQRQKAKARRGAVTRSEFLLSRIKVVRTPRIVYVSPELHKTQPIAGRADPATSVPSREERDENREPGFAPGVRLQGKEGILGPDQLRNADIALSMARQSNAGPKATLALAEACIVEAPDFANPVGGTGTSSGILQLIASHLGGSTSTRGGRRDVALVCSIFLRSGYTGRGGAMALERQHPSWTAGQIAQAVQGSAYPERYDQYQRQAAAIIAAWGGPGGSIITADMPATTTVVLPYEFSQGPPGGPANESAWAAGLRLADEVGWRFFAVIPNRVYFIAEEDLMESRPRMTLRERHNGVDNIDFDIDSGAVADTATVTCRAAIWNAPPGTVVLVDGNSGRPREDR